MMQGSMMQKNGFMKTRYLIAAVAAAAVLPANAALAGAGSDQTIGDIVTNTQNSFANFPNLLSLLAYMAGLVLSVSATLKLKDHVVGGPGAPALGDGIKRFIAGGAFLSAPFVSESIYHSTFGPGTQIGVTSRTGAAVDGTGLDGMVVRLMSDIGGPVENLLTGFCYVAAIAFMLVGINRLTKRAEDGPRGPAGMGTIMTFVTSGALFAFGDMMGTFSSSLFGDSTIATRASIANNVGMTTDEAARVQTVIEGVMAFVMIVGFIAFIRGWFVLKNFADGNQGATMAQGLTFLFGGALAINLGELVNALQETVGISGLTFS